MKKFFIDKGFVLICGCFIFLYLPPKVFPAFGMIMRIALLLSMYIICKELFLLPIDLLCGKKQEELYFSRLDGIRGCELFADVYYVEWVFYDRDKSLRLLVPIACSGDTISNMDKPMTDEKVLVTYYPRSKILVSWDDRLYA